MGEQIKEVYNRRRPERSDYYRIIESSFEEFEQSYPDLYENPYGNLRKEVMAAIYAFLECGIPENGVARVRCEECGDDFFVSFSCKQRVICSSCATKRSLLFAEKIKEIVKPLSHILITFSIPKILRAYFRRNRKLLKLLAQSAHFAVEKYLREALGIKDGLTGGIYCVQSHGALFNFNPHVHGIALGGIENGGKLYEQTNISTKLIAELFRARLLTLLKEQGVIKQELVDMLMSWNHTSGFNVHTEGRINGNDENAIENISRYISRAPLSVDRVTFNPEESTVTVNENKNLPHTGTSATYTVLEFMALLASHIPSYYEAMTYYFGVYSSSHRGKEKREHIENQETEIIEIAGRKGFERGKPTSTWAQLIRKVFEINPLSCKKCGGKMRIIAFIRTETEIKKILRHIGQETSRAPPFKPFFPEKGENENYYGDFMPDYDDYCRDEMYEAC